MCIVEGQPAMQEILSSPLHFGGNGGIRCYERTEIANDDNASNIQMKDAQKNVGLSHKERP